LADCAGGGSIAGQAIGNITEILSACSIEKFISSLACKTRSCVTCAIQTVRIIALSIEEANSAHEQRNVPLFTLGAEQKRRAFSAIA
jgi:hypothetical protein